MAEKQDSTPSPSSSSSSNVNTNTFNKGMMKDYNESFIGDGLYTHARNAVNSSHDGQVGVIGNEPSNLSCVDIPYSVIGTIHLTDDQWIIFSTDDVNSQIGIFDESACSYAPLKSPDNNTIDFNCLGFKRTNLITGVCRKRFDCDRIVYFDDGLNPTRTLDVTNVPVIQNCVIPAGGTCEICTELITAGKATLNCEAIRIAPFVTHPCITIKRGEVSGTLPNGSYQAAIAYLVNGSRVTDYIGLSDVQGLFTHENTSSSLEITISDVDERFNEFELVILSNINAQTVAKKIGTYSTGQGIIYVDRWSAEFITVSVSDIVLRTEPIEKSDAMYSVGKYLLRVGSYSKFKFNYQPLANQIRANWTAVEYPGDYYVKQNHNTGYMRDEVYSFFIRFIYNTGEFSDSYHIPGRASIPSDLVSITGGDAYEGTRSTWQVYNTGSVTSTVQSNLSDGGKIIARGQMAYWESTERYPNDKPDIWGDLCGKAIRHHKMPDETRSSLLSIHRNFGKNIVLLGVEFSNIQRPLDQNGNPIMSIVGYQILRGSREGNKSIIAKGLINNMRTYDVPEVPNTVGLFQNYPYNDLRPDPYLTSDPQNGDDGTDGKPFLTGYKKDYFSFHSPETTFNNPFLNATELKVYSLYSGNMNGYFENPYKHPRDSQITDLANDLVITLAGLMSTIQSVSAIAGGFDVTLGADTDVVKNGIGVSQVMAEGLAGAVGTAMAVPAIIANAAAAIALYGIPAVNGINTILNLVDVDSDILNSISNLFPGTVSLKQQLYRMFKQIVPKVQFARQFNSHGFYNQVISNTNGNIRRKILNSIYVSSNIQQFPNTTLSSVNYRINNINRSRVVVLQTNTDILDPENINGGTEEETRYLISQQNTTSYNKRLFSYYTALKLSIPSQYGQLESIKQLVISSCYSDMTSSNTVFSTSVLFGGDVYINRFTEKNTMFFFTDWLMGQPDLIEYDYTKYINVPYPRYWINTEYNGPATFNTSPGSNTSPQYFRSLDDVDSQYIPLSLKRGAFYLFNSGVRDFFVESEVNVAYRDWEDDIAKQHYDTYRFTDLSLMFRSDLIRNSNYYKYDYSLSISRLVTSSITWGSILERNYNPEVAATCYTYRPDRVLYSLPQNEESRRDTWRVFLANNYRDFPSPVSSIKSINKTGALFMMARQSPIQFTGVEELRMDGTNTKVTIGDGGLFNQELQSVVNVDKSYEYGSNQGRYCAINTTHGLFWVSQNQGKVFQLQGGLNDITNGGLKWWFAKYLPSQVVSLYPDYPLADNPVVGVGVQLIYDNIYELLYLIKKDYKPKFTDASTLELRNGQFYIPGTNTTIPLTNTAYFEDASFTASYDPKAKAWISFHDWIPTFVIPSRTHFLTIKENTFWKHNVRCDSYGNYYGVDYPFEVEFVSTTGQTVNTMRSIEYMLEVYNYYNDCKDKFHVLDQNFDQAIVYNSEQISGNLLLTLKDKTNPFNMLNYPIINPGAQTITINFAKEENKYRFNQFWDITKDRGEFTGGNVPMFITSPDGYKYNINAAYVNYSKDALQHKKFRHYVNRVFLRKSVSGNNKMLFKISNEKLLQSPR